MHLVEQSRILQDTFDKAQRNTKAEVDSKTQGRQAFENSEKAKLDFTLNVCIVLIGTSQKKFPPSA